MLAEIRLGYLQGENHNLANQRALLNCRERVASIANGGAILVTWANHHYLDFAVNWLNHMHQLAITSYMIGAMDDNLLKVNKAHIWEKGHKQTCLPCSS